MTNLILELYSTLLEITAGQRGETEEGQAPYSKQVALAAQEEAKFDGNTALSIPVHPPARGIDGVIDSLAGHHMRMLLTDASRDKRLQQELELQ